MKRLIRSVLHQAGYEVSRYVPDSAKPPGVREREKYPDATDREWQIYRRVKPFTMVLPEGILSNIRAIDYIERNRIPGDIVECGVWRGGSSMAMALSLRERSRTLWMYDTFAGMTEPTDKDLNIKNEKASALLEEAKQCETPEESLLLACASLETVERNMQSTGYPDALIKYVPGPVEQTIPDEIPEQIALLRLDTDYYESTLCELAHLYPRLSKGGILVLDDYGAWQGARRAVDEYLGGRLFLSRIGYDGRLAVKPWP